MNTSIRARHDERGFSFVELLVTIIIAAIAFAAMVPLFVQASQAGQGDRARVTAANIAQDKIEKIRQLDWDSITTTYLNSPTFWQPTAFGPTAVAGDGTGKTYNVRYWVDAYDVNDAVLDLSDPLALPRAFYRVVTVAVDWNAPPAPVKTVTLRTVINRQWAGPQMIGLDLVEHEDGVIKDGVGDFTSEKWLTASPAPPPLSGSPVVISAFISLNDVVYMDSPTGVLPETSGRVEIAISGPGLALPTKKIETPVSGTDNEYSYSWDWPAALDGIYTITATGYSYKGFQGTSLTETVRIDTGPPSAVPISSSWGINDVAGFTWSKANCGDLQCYRVTRWIQDPVTGIFGSEKIVAGGWVPPAPPVAYTSTTFIDSSPEVLNGTTYLYSIVAIDQLYQTSAETTVTLTPESGTVPVPLPPASVSASPVGDAASVTWAASPSVGVAGYNVYQTDAAGGNLTSVGYYAGAAGGSTVPDVLQAYNSTRYYQVTAVVPAGMGFPTAGESDYSPVVTGLSGMVGGVQWAKVTTGLQPTYKIRLYNNQDLSRNMELLFLGRFGLDTPVSIRSWSNVGGKTDTSYVSGQAPGKYRILSQIKDPHTTYPWVPMLIDSPPPSGTTLTGPTGDYTINVP